MGDHGMADGGGHGGSTTPEVLVPFLVISGSLTTQSEVSIPEVLVPFLVFSDALTMLEKKYLIFFFTSKIAIYRTYLSTGLHKGRSFVIVNLLPSVGDPDVFELPGSGSFYHQAKKK